MEDLLKIVTLVQRFASIERATPITNRSSMETDAEHSYQLSMMCWYLIERYGLKYNKILVYEYCMAHDLVEIYAGDTDVFTASASEQDSKETKENQALERICSENRNFTSLCTVISSYEKKTDGESRFVYIVDKMLPVLNTLLAGGSYYKDNNVTFNQWKNWFLKKRAKIESLPEEIVKLTDSLLDSLEEEHSNLFADSNQH